MNQLDLDHEMMQDYKKYTISRNHVPTKFYGTAVPTNLSEHYTFYNLAKMIVQLVLVDVDIDELGLDHLVLEELTNSR